MAAPFELLSVVHLVRPAGFQARDLEQFREGVAKATASTLFLHTVQNQLRHPAATSLPPDDFSSWVNGVVQDRETAERMSFTVQYRGGSPEELRKALLEVLDAIPQAKRIDRDAPAEGSFVFLDTEPVTIPTGTRVPDPEALVPALIEAEPAVWFYHLIEQPWLHPHTPSLVDWVRGCGDNRLGQWFEEMRLSGRTLEDMRKRLTRRWRQSRLGRRVAEAQEVPEDERREAGRAAVANLVRRITSSGEGGA